MLAHVPLTASTDVDGEACDDPRGQRAALVPGSFSSSLNAQCGAECYQQMIELDASDYFQWAAEEPDRIAAIIPWHWGGCESNPDCRAHLSEIGTVSLPSVIETWKALMHSIMPPGPHLR